MSTVLLDKDRHDRTRFNCGVDALNSYLRMMAGQQARRDNSRTFVLPDAANESQIIGF